MYVQDETNWVQKPGYRKVIKKTKTCLGFFLWDTLLGTNRA